MTLLIRIVSSKLSTSSYEAMSRSLLHLEANELKEECKPNNTANLAICLKKLRFVVMSLN